MGYEPTFTEFILFKPDLKPSYSITATRLVQPAFFQILPDRSIAGFCSNRWHTASPTNTFACRVLTYIFQTLNPCGVACQGILATLVTLYNLELIVRLRGVDVSFKCLSCQLLMAPSVPTMVTRVALLVRPGERIVTCAVEIQRLTKIGRFIVQCASRKAMLHRWKYVEIARLSSH